jgi:hypothetical protein
LKGKILLNGIKTFCKHYRRQSTDVPIEVRAKGIGEAAEIYGLDS